MKTVSGMSRLLSKMYGRKSILTFWSQESLLNPVLNLWKMVVLEYICVCFCFESVLLCLVRENTKTVDSRDCFVIFCTFCHPKRKSTLSKQKHTQIYSKTIILFKLSRGCKNHFLTPKSRTVLKCCFLLRNHYRYISENIPDHKKLS